MSPFPVPPSQLTGVAVTKTMSSDRLKERERASSSSTRYSSLEARAPWSSGEESEELGAAASESSARSRGQDKAHGIVSLGEFPSWLWREQPDQDEEEGARTVASTRRSDGSATKQPPSPQQKAEGAAEAALILAADLSQAAQRKQAGNTAARAKSRPAQATSWKPSAAKYMRRSRSMLDLVDASRDRGRDRCPARARSCEDTDPQAPVRSGTMAERHRQRVARLEAQLQRLQRDVNHLEIPIDSLVVQAHRRARQRAVQAARGDDGEDQLHQPRHRQGSTEQRQKPKARVASPPPKPPVDLEEEDKSYSDSERSFLKSAEQFCSGNSSLIVLGAEEEGREEQVYGTAASGATTITETTTGGVDRQTTGRMMSDLAQRMQRALTPRRSGTFTENTENAVIIFDWDDTLMPTSFIKHRIWTQMTPEDRKREACLDPSSPFYTQLVEHAQIVENILRSAREVARVAIVTLATRYWVTLSSQMYLPGLDLEALLVELDIEVHSADPNSKFCKLREALGQDPCKTAKRAAMQRCLKKLYANVDARWNVISIGDSTIEKEAIKECLKLCASTSKRQPLCKTVKLRENMTLVELGQELKKLRPTLQRLVAYGRAFDRTQHTLGSMWQPAISKLIRI